MLPSHDSPLFPIASSQQAQISCIASQANNHQETPRTSKQTQLNPTQPNSTQRLIFECLPNFFPNPTSRALPGRHIFASQLAKGKSFIASGAILRSISTHGNLQQNHPPPVGSHVLHPENGEKIPWEISGEFQP